MIRMKPISPELIALAKEVAIKAHKGQVRKFTQEPYINHPRRVSENVLEYIKDKIMYYHPTVYETVAWLHDAVEDSDLTIRELYAMGFPIHVVLGVESVTKIPGENYFNFIKRCMDNKVGIFVKIADLTDNMSDLHEGSMKNKYRLAKYILELRLGVEKLEDADEVWDD